MSDPGLLRNGPAEKILDVSDDVLREAVRSSADRVIDVVLYVPGSLAYEIRGLDAGGLIGRLAGLYARALYLAERSAPDGARDELRRSAIEQAFAFIHDVGGHAIAHRPTRR